MHWCDRFGDADGDGFVEYGPQTGSGLVNQGWKDSYDSIFHTDGSLAGGPIALCEVQGYVFAAKTQAAKLARRMAPVDRPLERFLVLNGLTAGHALKTGDKVKLITTDGHIGAPAK